MEDTNGSTTTGGLTLAGILAIKEPLPNRNPNRTQNRTLLDLIRDEPGPGTETKKKWKMVRQRLRLKLVGYVCTDPKPVLDSVVQINVGSRTMMTRNGTDGTSRLSSHSVNGNVNNNNNNNNNNSRNISEVVRQPEPGLEPEEPVNINENNNIGEPEWEPEVPVKVSLMSLLEVDSNENNNNSNGNISGVVRQPQPGLEPEGPVNNNENNNNIGEPEVPVKVSLMSLLEVDGSVCFDDVDDDVEEVVGDGGGGGGDQYNNCCVCMVRHKGAAFIPCGHTFCRHCSRELFVKRANCPLCNNFILEILDIF